MKTTVVFIFCLVVTILLNGFYLEYCVSRPCAEWLTIVLGMVLVVVDIAMLVLAVKTLKKVLNL